MDETQTLRLKWRETWPGEDHHDFSAYDSRMSGEVIGRIYRIDHHPLNGQWFWSFTAHGPGITRPSKDRGYADAPRIAAAKVEEAWFAAVKDLPEDAPPASVGFKQRKPIGADRSVAAGFRAWPFEKPAPVGVNPPASA